MCTCPSRTPYPSLASYPFPPTINSFSKSKSYTFFKKISFPKASSELYPPALFTKASLVAQAANSPLALWETQVRSLGQGRSPGEGSGNPLQPFLRTAHRLAPANGELSCRGERWLFWCCTGLSPTHQYRTSKTFVKANGKTCIWGAKECKRPLEKFCFSWGLNSVLGPVEK